MFLSRSSASLSRTTIYSVKLMFIGMLIGSRAMMILVVIDHFLLAGLNGISRQGV